MLERFFKTLSTLRRLRGGPAGPFLDGFAQSMFAAGYASDDPTEKLEALAVMKAPALRPGKFRPPDRLIAALSSTVKRTRDAVNP